MRSHKSNEKGGLMFKYMVPFLVIGISSAGPLLTNGDFEQTLDTAWTQTAYYPTYLDTIDRATGFHPDLDYEVRVKKYDYAYARLSQTVDIWTTDLEFSVDAKLYAYEYTSTASYWATASIVLAYRNVNGGLLGQTRICYNTPHCPYTNSSTFHMRLAPDPNNWYTYSFNINDELDSLPGVNPADVAKIEVALYDTTNGC